MSTPTLADRNVVAAFRDLEHAEEAVEALHEAGFDDDRLSLLGRPVAEVEEATEPGPGEPVGGDVFKHVASGGAAGAVAGGVLGALATAAVAMVPGVGLVAGTGALLGAVGGAGAGATVGSIVEGESALRTGHSWHQVFDAIKEGAIVLGVHDDDPRRVDEAQAILERLAPMDLQRVNSRGETVVADQ